METEIDIVSINPEGDGVTALYIDGSLHSHGDEYHDKMDVWISGFLDGLKFAEVDFLTQRWEVSGETKLGRQIAEQGESPPQLLKDYPKKYLKVV